MRWVSVSKVNSKLWPFGLLTMSNQIVKILFVFVLVSISKKKQILWVNNYVIYLKVVLGFMMVTKSYIPKFDISSFF